jgi:hypothetical protein
MIKIDKWVIWHKSCDSKRTAYIIRPTGIRSLIKNKADECKKDNMFQEYQTVKIRKDLPEKIFLLEHKVRY